MSYNEYQLIDEKVNIVDEILAEAECGLLNAAYKKKPSAARGVAEHRHFNSSSS